MRVCAVGRVCGVGGGVGVSGVGAGALSASAVSGPPAVSPVATAVERRAVRWVQSRLNPNVSGAACNAELAFALLRLAHRRESRNPHAQRSANIVLDPIACALRMQQQPLHTSSSSSPLPLLEEATEAEAAHITRLVRATDHAALRRGHRIQHSHHHTLSTLTRCPSPPRP